MTGRGGVLVALSVGLWSPSCHASLVEDLHQRLKGGCWSCEVLGRVADQGFRLARGSFGALSHDLSVLLGLSMALWILVWAVGLMAPVTGARLGNQGAVRLASFALVAALLDRWSFFWEYGVVPVIGGTAWLAAIMLGTGLGVACPAVGGGSDGIAGAIGQLTCPLAGIQDVFSRGMLTGLAMISGAGWHGWIDLLKIWSWPGRLLQVGAGVCLATVYAAGFLLFPLFLADALLGLAIIAVLAPPLLVAALFAPVRRLAVRAVAVAARSSLSVGLAALTTGLAATMVGRALAALGGDGAGKADWPALIQGLEQGSLKLSLVDGAFWAVLGVGILAIVMIRSARAMAASLIDGASGLNGAALEGGALLGGAAAAATGWLITRISGDVEPARQRAVGANKESAPAGLKQANGPLTGPGALRMFPASGMTAQDSNGGFARPSHRLSRN
jgi:hypothetical protein